MGELFGNYDFVWYSFAAGILASFACGLGALPLLIKRFDVKDNIGYGYSFASGLMFAASVYNLLLPSFTLGFEESMTLFPVSQTLLGLALGCLFIWWVQRKLHTGDIGESLSEGMGGKMIALVFITMTFHSIPEGVAVGVGFASDTHGTSFQNLGVYIALAISIHNIPEGLAVAIPLRAAGASIKKCFWMAFLTSLPQAIAAVPASLAVWFFEPLMHPLFGFAAGAMMYLVVAELLPESYEDKTRDQVAVSFMLGFVVMVLVQVTL